ncbi:MAG: hypothetical protein LKE46_08915 [Clostridium sp.]|jgi:hypothetical protein|uniref:lysine 5,6-aminomutase reactivase subunit KamB n=1 Tax=Clostridium sp. TaxID=1506 RepID=UPI0025BAE6C8|nr:hypothetical protein [Clostridium sp.]MCH3964387.1 hypothetical protein [Clostridium sp.]MCI1715562.1 hypothetical protein [Clostridium sp.]MCI1799646.1 hypothetical protein [Clostridium sp.]MCI1813746.1 hypothetical protein [Clostridium sp.]MCI1870459.1 hypothetical protein [Clostridium sp.]
MKRSDDFENLLDGLNRYRSISLIGIEKNTGKTTTLKFLLRQLEKKKVGITSIGRDGEGKDIVTSTEKPRIYIGENIFVATSKSCLLKSDATLDILDEFNMSTPLGNIVVGKSIYPGFIEIAGPSTKEQMRYLMDRFLEYGCELAIIDGALSRKTFASPEVTEASILCVGAAFSENMEKLVGETCNLLELFSIEKAGDDIGEIYDRSMIDCRIAFVYGSRIEKSKLKTAIGSSKEIISNLGKKPEFIFIKGVLTDGLIMDIAGSALNPGSTTFVVEDSTKLFLSKRCFDSFKARGGRIKVRNSMNIIGISVNPVSTSGYAMNYEVLRKKLKANTDIPVFNVMEYGLDVIE